MIIKITTDSRDEQLFGEMLGDNLNIKQLLVEEDGCWTFSGDWVAIEQILIDLENMLGETWIDLDIENILS